jgi:glycosyltransferase involved in cell wall biosynthesis
LFRGQRIAVVVPAFNEAEKIVRTLRSIPGFVDHVLVVDDASVDATARRALRTQRRGLELIRHGHNRGVGAAIASGYQRALGLGADVTAVMAGDSQMDPADLGALVATVVDGADYAKGNRFRWLPAITRSSTRSVVTPPSAGGPWPPSWRSRCSLVTVTPTIC